MKLLSLARQHFHQLIEDGCIYVDKTRLIHELLTDTKQVFLSRPRRFGKSLLLTTIADLFLGRKDLFKGLWIENKWNWDETFPVVHFYMDKTLFQEIGLENGIKNHLKDLAETFGLVLTQDSPGLMLGELLTKVHEKTGKGVVLLFDEYDKPINDTLKDPQKAEQHREMLSNFYGAIKPNSDKLRFLMLTGVSKFSKVSIFSKLNQLSDITFNKKYLNLLGYTEKELVKYFPYYLKLAGKDLGLKQQELLDQIRYWYNGYSWDGKTSVYNPVSAMNFMENRDFRNFWFTTGTPTFLIDLLKRNRYLELDNVEVGQDIFESFTLENLEPTALMLQTGYLTIKETLPHQFYRLGYPNHEVRKSMLSNLLGAFSRHESAIMGPNVFKLRDAIFRRDWDRAKSIVNTLFRNIPYQLDRKSYELDFHALLFLVFRYMAFDARAEMSSLDGRSDVVLFAPDTIFILEFKINKTAQFAVEYIREKGYAEPFRHEGLPVTLVGINFNQAEREVDDWAAEGL